MDRFPEMKSHNTMSKIKETLRAFNEWLDVTISATFLSTPWTYLRTRNEITLPVPGNIRHKSVDRGRLIGRIARNLDWYLDAYPGLDMEEKRTIDALVSGRPEYRSRIREARRMDELLHDAGALMDVNRDSDTVRFAFVSEYVSASLIPKSLLMALLRFRRRLPGNAKVAASYNDYQERESMDELSVLRPAIDHFEAISGHVIRESKTEYITGTGYRLKFWEKTRRGISGVPKRNGDREAKPGRRERVFSAASSLANTFMIVAIVIVVLYSANYSNQSPTERMAHIRSSDLSWVEVGLSDRGLLSDWELKAYEQYERAVGIIARSRKSVFGLFRTYRSKDLYLARRILENTHKDRRIARRQIPEALLLLGKLNFLLGDMDKAIPALRDASYQDGPAAEEADKFLHLFGPQN